MEEEKSVIQLCRSLIRNQSYSGKEQQVADVLKLYFESNGYQISCDEYGNMIGCIKGSRPGPKILFDGHMDTVPVANPEQWEHDPFAADTADGRIYGRGTSDMKGALAAMAAAVTDYAKACGGDFPGELYVAGVVHEECFEGVAARKISERVKPDYVIIGEASQLNLKIGQRGRAEIKVEVFGVPAHSANPEKGINAVYKMCEVIQAIQSIEPPEHPVLGKGIMELTDIKSSPYPGASVVPEYCAATYDRRLLVGETKESVIKPVQDKLDELMAGDRTLKAKVSYASGKEICYTGNTIEGERFFPGWLFDEKEEYIQKIYQELYSNGYQPEITQYNFCTNGSHYAGEAGIRTIGLGPSRENLAHTRNEYIETEQLIKVKDCYEHVIKALLGA